MPKVRLKPRKQPLQSRSQHTVNTILDAATRILERDGLAGFTTNSVAERAGVSIGSLYQYFPNKDALIVALIQQEQQILVEALVAAVATIKAVPLEQGIDILVRSAIAGHRNKPRMAAAIDHEEARLPVAAILATYNRQLDAAIVEFLTPHFPGCTVEELTRQSQTVRVIAQSVIDAFVSGTKPDFERARSDTTRAVLGYLLHKA
jgi:AcrR family transcriptional regulator